MTEILCSSSGTTYKTKHALQWEKIINEYIFIRNVKIKNNTGPYVSTDKNQSTINHPIYILLIKLQVPSILKEFFKSIFRQSSFPPTPSILVPKELQCYLNNTFYFCKALYFYKVSSNTLYFC